ncbi:Hypothetical protein A7982_10853 [Minicystis rosea]|nr:Hypothetical protein A7982_10853 [Minicystis rosea]
MKTTPFRIDVSQETLDDLRARLQRTRLPDAPRARNGAWARTRPS